MGELTFNEIQDQLLPDVQAETDWFGGVAGLPSTAKRVVLVAPSANYQDEIRAVTSVAKGIADYGEGSPMAGAIEAALNTNPKAELYALAVEPGSGAATLTCTFAGSATSAGVLKVWVGGRLLQVSVPLGTAAATLRDLVVAQYTRDAYNFAAAISAGVAAGAVDVDAVTDGLMGTTIRVRVDCSGVPGITVDDGSGAASIAEAPLVNAAGTDTSPATALATLEGDQRYHLFGLASQDAAAILALKTHVEDQSVPSVARFGRGIVPWTGNSATAQTQADTSSAMRIQIVRHTNSPRPAWEVMGACVAESARRNPKQAADDKVLKWLMPQFSTGDWPTELEMEADLKEGVTPLKCERHGQRVMWSRSVHTMHGASLQGNWAMDTDILEISDYTKTSIIARFKKLKGANFKTDTDPGEPATITPRRATSELAATLKELTRQDYLDVDVEAAVKAGQIVAQQNAVNPDRVDCAYPLKPARKAHFWAIKETYTY